MKWYDHLYLGDSVRHPRRLRWSIQHGVRVFDVYVITLAANGQDLLDIIPARQRELLRDSGPGRRELRIVGLARGYGEALEVVQRIVEETYENTGDVDVRRWLRQKRRGQS